jgi:hypothetical protein
MAAFSSAGLRATPVRLPESCRAPRIFPTGEISFLFTLRSAQLHALRAAIASGPSPVGRLQTTDGRTNCRIYRSLNGIVEGRVCDPGNARYNADAPNFRGRRRQTDMDRRTGVSQ